MISITVAILPGGYAEIRRTIGLVHLANLSYLARRNDRWMRSSISKSACRKGGVGSHRLPARP